jgi:hypothetical protein
MQENILTAGGAVAEIESALPVAEAERLHAKAREAAQTATTRLTQIKAAQSTANRDLIDRRARRGVLLDKAAESEVARLLDDGAGDIEAVIRELSENRSRIEVCAVTLAHLTEQVIPAAEIANFDALAGLKDTAADLIDARRWQRLREHSGALDALAESEGAVEIKPARFDAEGLAANEMRSEAANLRERRRMYAGKIATMVAAAREARGQF